MSKEAIRVLIVEDNPDLNFLMKEGLKARKTCNYDAKSAVSLAEACEALSKDHFDVVLLDLDLSDSKGVDTASSVYRCDPHIPIIAVTGRYTNALAADVLASGAQDYLVKGKYDDDALDRAIRYSIERKKTERKLERKARRSDVIFRLLQDINPGMLPGEMLEFIVKAAKSLVAADTASVILLDEEHKGRPKIVASESSGLEVDGAILQPSLDENTSITGWVVKNRQPLLLPGNLKDDERFKNIAWKEGIRCSINAPIIFRDSVKGTLNLNVTSSDYSFTEDDMEAVVALANHAAIAFENSGLYKSMKDVYIEKLKKSNEDLKETNDELKKTQDQLVQSEKMSAIGQLASGVAHEINNPLSGVLGNIQIIKMELRAGTKIDDMGELLTVIEESARRCKAITQNLLDFSRLKKDVFEAFDVHRALNSVIMLLAHSLKNLNIKIEKRYAEGLPGVFGNTNEIQQVFLNMVSNARWAIGKKGKSGGSITFETRKIDDDFIEVRFSDTGIGMSNETAQRIFDPFYTTKEVGKGTGLGLSLCYEIMRRHNGALNVESEEGKGTTFIIKLPIAKDASGPPRKQ